MQVNPSSKTTILLKQRTVYIIYFVTLAALNVANVFAGRMNTWNIYRSVFWHFVKHDDIYKAYPAEFGDQYQYSPSFPALLAPFASLPNYVGYFLWNNVSMLLIPFLIFKFKHFSIKHKAIVCYISLLEMLVCLQGTQTNVMIANLILLSFLCFENKQQWVAAFALAAGIYIKVYPVVAVSLFLLYPDKLKFISKFFVAMVVLGVLPLIIYSPLELVAMYQKWFIIMKEDPGVIPGSISLTGIMQAYFNISDSSKLIVQIIGTAIFCLMYVRTNLFKEYYYRIYFLCSILIWVALFNHVSEITSYAIAICGVGFWLVHQKQTKAMKIFIPSFVLIATVLSMDPTPRFILNYIYEHSLKSLPYAGIWLCILYQMLTKKKEFFWLHHETQELDTKTLYN